MLLKLWVIWSGLGEKVAAEAFRDSFLLGAIL